MSSFSSLIEYLDEARKYASLKFNMSSSPYDEVNLVRSYHLNLTILNNSSKKM